MNLLDPDPFAIGFLIGLVGPLIVIFLGSIPSYVRQLKNDLKIRQHNKRVSKEKQ